MKFGFLKELFEMFGEIPEHKIKGNREEYYEKRDQFRKLIEELEHAKSNMRSFARIEIEFAENRSYNKIEE